MPRPASIAEPDLIDRLAGVFRDVGYHGASLAQLAKAAGLHKASLYHRFPGGKQQMAAEVLAASLDWVGKNIVAPLTAEGPPEQRLATATASIERLYDGGRQACVLNMLSSPRADDGPFSEAIRGAFASLIAAFAHLARDAGFPPDASEHRARRAVMLLQGSLVMSRGIGSTAPFLEFLETLPQELLAPAKEVAE